MARSILPSEQVGNGQQRWQDALAKCEASLRVKVNVSSLLPKLEVVAGGFMTQEERYSVEDAEKGTAQVSAIIRILRRKEEKDFLSFCKILESTGNEVSAQELRKSAGPIIISSAMARSILPSEQVGNGQQRWQDALAKCEASLRVKVNVSSLLPKLERPAGGFMTQEERYSVEDAEKGTAQVSAIIRILRRKEEKDFLSFCKILESTGNEVSAQELRKSAGPIIRVHESSSSSSRNG
jgi:hypothetical protein